MDEEEEGSDSESEQGEDETDPNREVSACASPRERSQLGARGVTVLRVRVHACSRFASSANDASRTWRSSRYTSTTNLFPRLKRGLFIDKRQMVSFKAAILPASHSIELARSDDDYGRHIPASCLPPDGLPLTVCPPVPTRCTGCPPAPRLVA